MFAVADYEWEMKSFKCCKYGSFEYLLFLLVSLELLLHLGSKENIDTDVHLLCNGLSGDFYSKSAV